MVSCRSTHLSSVARKRSRVFGGAGGSVLDPLVLLHPEGGAAVAGVVLQRLPRPSKVLRALQGHDGGPRGAKDDDEVSEVEGGLQVQLHRLRLHPLRRLPPGVWVAEGGVRHEACLMGQVSQAGVAFGALGGAAGQVGVGVRVQAGELSAVVATDGLCQNLATQSQVTHAGVAGSALTAGGHTCSKHVHTGSCKTKTEFTDNTVQQEKSLNVSVKAKCLRQSDSLCTQVVYLHWKCYAKGIMEALCTCLT